MTYFHARDNKLELTTEMWLIYPLFKILSVILYNSLVIAHPSDLFDSKYH